MIYWQLLVLERVGQGKISSIIWNFYLDCKKNKTIFFRSGRKTYIILYHRAVGIFLHSFTVYINLSLTSLSVWFPFIIIQRTYIKFHYIIALYRFSLNCIELHWSATMLFIPQFIFLHLLSPCTLLLYIVWFKSFFEVEQSAKRSTLSDKIVLFSFSMRGRGGGVTPNISLCEEFKPRIIFYGLQAYEKEGLFTSWSMWKSREIFSSTYDRYWNVSNRWYNDFKLLYSFLICFINFILR